MKPLYLLPSDFNRLHNGLNLNVLEIEFRAVLDRGSQAQCLTYHALASIAVLLQCVAQYLFPPKAASFV